MQHQFNRHILREYDIRGTFDDTLTAKDAYVIGHRFAQWIREHRGKTVVVGRDGRLSSPILMENLLQGLLEGGIDVADVQIGPTPMLYYALKILEADAGIMVTGSHNPAQDNGFKFALQHRPFFGEDIQEMAALKGDLPPMNEVDADDPTQRYKKHNVLARYVERLLTDYETPRRKLRIAWDCGNGAAGDVLKLLVEGIDATHFLMNTDIDGRFPAHHPDPTEPENLVQLIEKVKENQCDLGIAFDGDADRLGVVDAFGRIIWGDQLLTILACDLLKDHPGAKIITDVKVSQAFSDEVNKAGGQVIMWKTGHSLIKQHMNITGALLAGEMSGHIFFADRYYGYDDGLYAAIRLINIVQKSSLTLADMLDALPKYYSTPELRIPCVDDIKFQVMQGLASSLEQAGIPFNGIDGVRVQHMEGWWLVRASNTQAKLVARCESSTKSGLAAMEQQMNQFLSPIMARAERYLQQG